MPPRSKRDRNMRSPGRSRIEPVSLALDLPSARGFTSTPGRGAEAHVGEQHVIVGNDRHAGVARDRGPASSRSKRFRRRGNTVVCVAVDGRMLGFIAIADPAA